MKTARAVGAFAVATFLSTACIAELDYGLKDLSGQGVFISSSTEPGRRPGVPWLNANTQRTMFGLRFANATEVAKVVVRWSDFVPAPGSYFLGCIGEDGRMTYLPTANGRALYPLDSSTFTFSPIKAREVLVLTTRSRAGYANYVGCDALEVYGPPKGPPAWVRQPRWYFCEFDREAGALKNVGPDTEWFVSVAPWWPPLPLFHWIGLTADREGKEVVPKVVPESIKSGGTGDHDWIEFTMTFDAAAGSSTSCDARFAFAPGAEKPLRLTYALRTADETKDKFLLVLRAEGKVFAGRSCKVTPSNGRLVQGSVPVDMNAQKTVVPDTPDARAFDCDTAAGQVRVSTAGAASLSVATSGAEEAARLKLQRPFLHLAFRLKPNAPLDVTLSLPTGASERQPPPAYRWRAVGEPLSHDAGLGVFREQDLELVDSIVCGDPADGRECYDASNDPAFDKNYVKQHVNPALVADAPKYASKVTTILGRPCRMTTGDHGSYFRYVFRGSYEREVPYLLVVEYPDDVRRVAVLTGVTNDGGIDTGTGPHTGRFKRQAFPFTFAGPLMDPPDKPWAAFVNWGKRDQGIAIARIWVYRVRTMPLLPRLQGSAAPKNLAALYPTPDKQRYVGGYAQLFGANVFRDEAPMVGANWLFFNQDPHILINRRSYSTYRGGGYHPGTIVEWQVLLSRAEAVGVTLSIYLGQLLKLGYQDPDRDAFVGYVCYNPDSLPVKLRDDERKLAKDALDRSLNQLAKYQSLKFINVCEVAPEFAFAYRNVRDFVSDTGTKGLPETTSWEKARDFIYSHSELREKWAEWVCQHRLRFYLWLRDAIRRHRRDLVLVVSPIGFTAGFGDLAWYVKDDKHRKEMAAVGLRNIVEEVRTLGLDPQLYRGQPGFMLEVSGGGEAIGDPGTYPVECNDNWSDPALKQAMSCFAEGTMTWISFCFAEGGATPGGWTNPMFECPEVYRKALLEAALANVRIITAGSYGVPWRGLEHDFRDFAVPFRMLPYGNPERFDGSVEPSSPDVVVRKFGRHYALANLRRDPVEVTVRLPAGRSARLYDLSNGKPEVIANPSGTGNVQAKLALPPLSLRTVGVL